MIERFGNRYEYELTICPNLGKTFLHLNTKILRATHSRVLTTNRKETKVKVHNINGTADNTCKCGSWKAHWERYNEKGRAWPTYCVATGCLKRATVGAHVQKESSSSAKWYIIPFCDHHNACYGASVEVDSTTSFASANRSETCEY